MTERQREIKKMVYEKYPKTKKEFCCWQEKLRLTSLREAYAKRLESEGTFEYTHKADGLLRDEIPSGDIQSPSVTNKGVC